MNFIEDAAEQRRLTRRDFGTACPTILRAPVELCRELAQGAAQALVGRSREGAPLALERLGPLARGRFK